MFPKNVLYPYAGPLRVVAIELRVGPEDITVIQPRLDDASK